MHGLRLHLRRRLQWRMLGFGRLVLGAYADLTSGIVAAVVLLTAPAGAVIAALALAAAPPRRPPLGRARARRKSIRRVGRRKRLRIMAIDSRRAPRLAENA